MPAVCDVNYLIALASDKHDHHEPAVAWLSDKESGEVIICRIAQLGFLRLLTNPAVMGEEVMTIQLSWRIWGGLLQDDRFIFMPHEPTGLDVAFSALTSKETFSRKLWTDAYLAAFAIAGNFSIVSFDRDFGRFSNLNCEILRGDEE
jgi:toxin-antitoxin system PIN domain toxin